MFVFDKQKVFMSNVSKMLENGKYGARKFSKNTLDARPPVLCIHVLCYMCAHKYHVTFDN